MPAIPDKVKRIKQIRFQDLSTPQDHFETENRPGWIRPGGTALQSIGALPPTSQSSYGVTKSHCTNFGRCLAVAVALGWVLINIAVIFSTDVENVGSSWLRSPVSGKNTSKSAYLAQILTKLNPRSDTVQDQANAATEEEPQSDNTASIVQTEPPKSVMPAPHFVVDNIDFKEQFQSVDEESETEPEESLPELENTAENLHPLGVVGWSGDQHKFEVDGSLGFGNWVGETLNTKSNGFHEPPQRTTHQGAAASSAGLTHNPEASRNNHKHWLPQPEKILRNRNARPFRATTGGSDPDPNQRMEHWISQQRVPVDWNGVPSRLGRFDLVLPRTAQRAKHLPFDRNVGSVVSKVPLGFSPN
eukprot:GHVN01017201.1.p1 GENE.GHVN01017201.1~~GHVN01017201.1.p1  ORF type:complete len:359 (-),score=38.61 GHVN01017201.1:33-1109(-)